MTTERIEEAAQKLAACLVEHKRAVVESRRSQDNERLTREALVKARYYLESLTSTEAGLRE